MSRKRSSKNKRDRNIRKSASLKLPALLTEYNNKCYWCHKFIVMRRSIPNPLILNISTNSITWRISPYLKDPEEKEEVRTALIASVDHLIRLHDGGSNRKANLVPSCIQCNSTRHKDQDIQEAKKQN